MIFRIFKNLNNLNIIIDKILIINKDIKDLDNFLSIL